MAKYIIAWHKDLTIIKSSSSGGAFTAISNHFLKEDNGIVYGCILDKNIRVIHIQAMNSIERDLMRGSKYIQSNMLDIYNKVEIELKNNKEVLFSGTPCQIAAICQYLKLKKVSMEKLLTVEVACHGVASSRFFSDYISHLEKKYKGKTIECCFRAKEKMHKIQQMRVRFDNNKTYISASNSTDWFYSVYHKNLILRPSCYNCKFAQEKRIADITIADSWGFKSENDIPKSLIIFNSKKSEKYLDYIKKEMNIIEVRKEDFKLSALEHPAKRPSNRDTFWKIYLNEGYLSAQRYVGNNTLKGKVKRIIANVLYKTNLDRFFKK